MVAFHTPGRAVPGRLFRFSGPLAIHEKTVTDPHLPGVLLWLGAVNALAILVADRGDVLLAEDRRPVVVVLELQ